ncbi:MAG: efflux RND transporter periplasmic adaptor subunit [Rhizobiales bacterium]|nr:efflux RND transporter periplasmic adaptor subunit [Hyphomicrobiales bacterium]
MKARHLTAVGLVAAAALWIASGYILPREHGSSDAAPRVGESEAQKPFRVAVIDTNVSMHSQKLVLSGRTEADRKVSAFARTGGIVTEVRVHRGSHVKKGDIVAILSDDAREAQVVQARALVEQRRIELEAKRRAGLASAEAELQRGVIRAPWDGVVTNVSEVGTSAFSFTGTSVADIVGLDPMLAVVEVSERKVGSIRVGDTAEVRLVSGQTKQGRVRYVSKSAIAATRTYRVEVDMPNADGAIPDGITAEVTIPLAPIPATRVPRSALIFSSAGDLGVRTVDGEGKVGFAPTTIVEDDQSFMWLAGVADGARVIVQGQDFVREGNRVSAVPATELAASR